MPVPCGSKVMGSGGWEVSTSELLLLNEKVVLLRSNNATSSSQLTVLAVEKLRLLPVKPPAENGAGAGWDGGEQYLVRK